MTLENNILKGTATKHPNKKKESFKKAIEQMVDLLTNLALGIKSVENRV